MFCKASGWVNVGSSHVLGGTCVITKKNSGGVKHVNNDVRCKLCSIIQPMSSQMPAGL